MPPDRAGTKSIASILSSVGAIATADALSAAKLSGWFGNIHPLAGSVIDLISRNPVLNLVRGFLFLTFLNKKPIRIN